MITFHISYQSENQYDHFVQEALFEFLVMPCTNETQKIIWENAQNSADSSPFYSRNVFGYNSLCFRVARPFNQLNFSFDCKVHKDVAGYIPDSRDCLPLDEEIRELESEAFQVDYILYTRQTTLTELPLHLVPASMRYRRNISLLQYVTELNEAIHKLIVYTPNITNVNTKATDVLVSPAGVCQDYSHLMIGILRSQQIPARYVSGYLNQGQQLIGSARMHAWIEVYIPRLGWVGFDPTNNLFADYHYIKVADGQDYDDCSPLKGYIKPSGINCTDHSVQVVEQ